MEQSDTISNTNSGKSSGLGWKIATAAASVVAICGIGFGIYGMLQSSHKDNQISDLKVQIEGSNGESTASETDKIEISKDSNAAAISDSIAKMHNPVISATAPIQYNVDFTTPVLNVNNSDYRADISIVNGEIGECHLYSVEQGDSTYLKNFSIDALSGKVYKAFLANKGHDATDSKIAFILEDGTVDYVSSETLLTAALSSGVATIEGKLPVGGFVVDALTVSMIEGISSAMTTIIVFADGTYAEL